jgi:hypothetical protein
VRKRFLPLGLILVVAILLTLISHNYIREAIVTPLLYFLWIGRLIFESIPQVVIWALFLFIVLLVAGRSLVKKEAQSGQSQNPETPKLERIEVWLKLLRRANQDDYYKWQLAQRIRKLALDTLAHHERLELKQVRQDLAAGELDIPSEIQVYLKAGMRSFSHFLGPKSRFRPRKQESSLDLETERVIQFLEDKIDDHID